MASATGIPERIPAEAEANGHNHHDSDLGDDEPLLGRRGDASQPEGRALYYNLIIGTPPLHLTSTSLILPPPRHSSNRPSRHNPPHRLNLGLRLPPRRNPLLRTPPPQQRRPPLPHSINPHSATYPHSGSETTRNTRAFHAQQLGD